MLSFTWIQLSLECSIIIKIVKSTEHIIWSLYNEGSDGVDLDKSRSHWPRSVLDKKKMFLW